MMNELGFQERLLIPPGGTERHQGAGVTYPVQVRELDLQERLQSYHHEKQKEDQG